MNPLKGVYVYEMYSLLRRMCKFPISLKHEFSPNNKPVRKPIRKPIRKPCRKPCHLTPPSVYLKVWSFFFSCPCT